MHVIVVCSEIHNDDDVGGKAFFPPSIANYKEIVELCSAFSTRFKIHVCQPVPALMDATLSVVTLAGEFRTQDIFNCAETIFLSSTLTYS